MKTVVFGAGYKKEIPKYMIHIGNNSKKIRNKLPECDKMIFITDFLNHGIMYHMKKEGKKKGIVMEFLKYSEFKVIYAA